MMDTTFIISICSLLGTGIGWLLFYPQKRRTEELKNSNIVIEQLKQASEERQKLYERSEQDSREKDAKIDELYQEINRHRDEKAVLREEKERVAVENVRLKLLKCEIPKCANRQPPTGY